MWCFHSHGCFFVPSNIGQDEADYFFMKPIDSEHDFNQHGGKFWSHPTLNQNKVKVLGVAKKKPKN